MQVLQLEGQADSFEHIKNSEVLHKEILEIKSLLSYIRVYILTKCQTSRNKKKWGEKLITAGFCHIPICHIDIYHQLPLTHYIINYKLVCRVVAWYQETGGFKDLLRCGRLKMNHETKLDVLLKY